MTALVVATFFAAGLAFALHVAHRDDARRERSIDDRIAARYRQPIRLGAWDGDTYSATTTTWNYGKGPSLVVVADTTEHDAPHRVTPKRVDGRAGRTPTLLAPDGVGVLVRDTGRDAPRPGHTYAG